MDKPRLHHFWVRLRWIKPWYFLVLAVISGIVCILALRANNEHMARLRQAVWDADKNGTNVQLALQDLQAYVTRHMNTSLSGGPNPVYPPIQLKYTYDRLVSAQADQIAQGNSSLYSDAQHYCEAQNHVDFSGRNRVPCIEQYVLSHTTTKPPTIPDSLYKFDFISPRWSPDLAGWSLLLTLVSLALFVISLAGRWWTGRRLA